MIKKILLIFSFFFLLATSLALITSPKEEKTKKRSMIIPKDHSELITSIELKTPFKAFKKCHLLNKRTKQFISSAILIKEAGAINEFDLSSERRIELAIPKKNLSRFINESEKIIAIPAESLAQQKKPIKKRSYEVIF